MTNPVGGFTSYDDFTPVRTFSRPEPRKSETGTLLSGAVLKAFTLLETDANGKLIPHSGIVEKALITFPTKVDTGETVIIAGLTFTAGSNATTTQAELQAAWQNLPAGISASAANTLQGAACSAAIGTFTSGTLTGYSTEKSTTTGAVIFVSTTPNAGVTDLTVSGTGDVSTVAVTAVNSPQKLVTGLLAYDVDASGGDVDVSYFSKAAVYDEAIVWANNIVTDTITLPDGTTKAVTNYNVGALSNLTKRKVLEGSGITVDFIATGETF